MRKLIALSLLLLASSFVMASASFTVSEVDAAIQNGRPVTQLVLFADGEIANYPKPQISGQSITTWQADCKNFYPSGSPRLCIVSYIQPTMAASTSYTVTFTNSANTCSACTGGTPSGYLNASQMASFNDGSGAGNWNFKQVFSVPAALTGGSTQTATVSAKTMLAGSDPGLNSFGDGKNNYWLQGPVVTAVIVREGYQSSGTMHSQYDYGWHWDGTTMNSNAGSPYSGNSTYASIHPWFILYFYPSPGTIKGEYITEIGNWTQRIQDQVMDLTYQSGSADTEQWAHVGARKLTDFSCTAWPTCTSATGSFTNSDLGLVIYISGTNYAWGTITTINSASSITITSECNSGCPATTSMTGYINDFYSRSRVHKTFWSGTALGHIRVDPNFTNLKNNHFLPYYDSSVSVSTSTNDTASATSWSNWASGVHGESLGSSGLNEMDDAYADNSEGAPLQRIPLMYYYNASTCGTAGSECAKAWAMLTGDYSSNDGFTCNQWVNGTQKTCNAVGGLGALQALSNVPFHMRESRVAATGNQTTTNYLYCSGFENKNSVGNSTNCTGAGDGNVADPTGPNDATGRALSRHAHSGDQWTGGILEISNVGTFNNGPWAWDFPNCDHWMDYAYDGYLNTASFYYLEEEQMSASWCISSENSSQGPGYSNGFFGFTSTNGGLRAFDWMMQTAERASWLAVDGSAEKAYYESIINSNLEILEGNQAITGTNLTPSSTNSACTSYNYQSANRWDWGRCTNISRCATTGTNCSSVIAPGLHGSAIAQLGNCPGDAGYMNTAVANNATPEYHIRWLELVLTEFRLHGYETAKYVFDDVGKRIVEMTMDSTYNPYTQSTYIEPTQLGTSCSGGVSTDPYFTSYSAMQGAFVSAIQTANTFENASPLGQFKCADHGYPLIVRASGHSLAYFNVSSSDANCPGGVCTAADTWTWLNTCTSYFSYGGAAGSSCSAHAGGSTGAGTSSCGSSDIQIKFALAELPASPSSGACIQTPNTIRTANTVMQ